MADEMSVAQLMEFRTAFGKYDKDNDQSIDTTELKKLLKELGENPESSEVTEIIDKVDADKSGSIQFTEFLELMKELKVSSKRFQAGMDLPVDQLLEYKAAFSKYDDDGDQTMDTKELVPLLKQIGENPESVEIKERLAEVDVDGSGTIQFNEFVALMQNLKVSSKRFQVGMELSVAELLDYQSAFAKFDKDNDKTMDTTELGALLKSLGKEPSPEQLKSMIAKVDKTNCGSVKFADFIALMKELAGANWNKGKGVAAVK